jgi:AcrR family transcriptional regulator
MPQQIKNTNQQKGKKKKGPPGKIKLADAMRQLLENKDFHSITTEEISRTAGINESLIYRYFGDKRGLLHHVMAAYLEQAHEQIVENLKRIKGAAQKLEVFIRSTFDIYCNQRVFAKIILIEVRNFPGYFESDTYQLVRRYSQMMIDIINEGAAAGEIREDIPPMAIRDMIIGGIEHVLLPALIFDRDVESNVLSEHLIAIILQGIIKKECSDSSQPKTVEAVYG